MERSLKLSKEEFLKRSFQYDPFLKNISNVVFSTGNSGNEFFDNLGLGGSSSGDNSSTSQSAFNIDLKDIPFVSTMLAFRDSMHQILTEGGATSSNMGLNMAGLLLGGTPIAAPQSTETQLSASIPTVSSSQADSQAGEPGFGFFSNIAKVLPFNNQITSIVGNTLDKIVDKEIEKSKKKEKEKLVQQQKEQKQQTYEIPKMVKNVVTAIPYHSMFPVPIGGLIDTIFNNEKGMLDYQVDRSNVDRNKSINKLVQQQKEQNDKNKNDSIAMNKTNNDILKVIGNLAMAILQNGGNTNNILTTIANETSNMVNSSNNVGSNNPSSSNIGNIGDMGLAALQMIF